MRRRYLPPWRRLLLEYVAMVLAFFAVMALTGMVFVAIIVMIAVMFLLRFTRPKYHEDGSDDRDQPTDSRL